MGVVIVPRHLDPRGRRMGQPILPAIAMVQFARSLRGNDAPALTLYSATWCEACPSARAWLDARGLAYTERQTDTDPEAAAYVQAHGGMVPTLRIEGRAEPVVGFSAAKYEAALAEAPTPARETGDCPEVRNAAGGSHSAPWSPPGPSVRECSSWYDAAAENIARAEAHPYAAQVGATKRAAQLRQLYDALPNRAWAFATDPERYTRAAADLAQAALCIVHESNAASRRRPDEKPRPAEEEGEPWWRRLWDKLPSLPDVGSWDWPELPDLPTFKIPPWAFLVAGGVLVLMLSRRSRRRER